MRSSLVTLGTLAATASAIALRQPPLPTMHVPASIAGGLDLQALELEGEFELDANENALSAQALKLAPSNASDFDIGPMPAELQHLLDMSFETRHAWREHMGMSLASPDTQAHGKNPSTVAPAAAAPWEMPTISDSTVSALTTAAALVLTTVAMRRQIASPVPTFDSSLMRL